MLSPDELRVLESYDVYTESLDNERKLISGFLPANHPNVEPFLWFIGLMKCYAHGTPKGENLWLLYPRGNRATHSCAPNAIYRNDNGDLLYIAIRDIQTSEPITISYIGCLYGSTISRQERLLLLKMLSCSCSKCTAPIDKARRIWCPHCRTKEEDGGTPAFAVYCGQSKDVNLPQIEAIRNLNKTAETDGWWMCTKCKLPLADAVMPLQMEETLNSLYENLSKSMGLEEQNKWMQYLTYLYRTTLMVLGPMHWLVGGCYFLFSKFYASAWKSAMATSGSSPADAKTYGDLCVSNGIKYLDFIEAIFPDDNAILYTDGAPWATVLMRISLEACEWSQFSQLAGRYVQKCNVVYGVADPMMQVFYQAVVTMHRLGPSNPTLPSAIRGLLDNYKNSSAQNGTTVEPDEVTRSTTHLEKNFNPLIKPWLRRTHVAPGLQTELHKISETRKRALAAVFGNPAAPPAAPAVHNTLPSLPLLPASPFPSLVCLSQMTGMAPSSVRPPAATATIRPTVAEYLSPQYLGSAPLKSPTFGSPAQSTQSGAYITSDPTASVPSYVVTRQGVATQPVVRAASPGLYSPAGVYSPNQTPGVSSPVFSPAVPPHRTSPNRVGRRSPGRTSAPSQPPWQSTATRSGEATARVVSHARALGAGSRHSRGTGSHGAVSLPGASSSSTTTPPLLPGNTRLADMHGSRDAGYNAPGAKSGYPGVKSGAESPGGRAEKPLLSTTYLSVAQLSSEYPSRAKLSTKTVQRREVQREALIGGGYRTYNDTVDERRGRRARRKHRSPSRHRSHSSSSPAPFSVECAIHGTRNGAARSGSGLSPHTGRPSTRAGHRVDSSRRTRSHRRRIDSDSDTDADIVASLVKAELDELRASVNSSQDPRLADPKLVDQITNKVLGRLRA
ncbi:hypothetical protein GNI_105680 [Gregarina niphandrodes]|uniref:SET domain-containing protein n=1 Tax=Gregarina niphandrodes TaxID=110365 RepID=A0A023B414_GRENI|nr:hypothetical protein GNI_105680 [Gregarina niphandrodes]EZG56108.1 hypothetical protein GNI_105680 [Gregarina niphandrodes]|eukprot:XP_011131341.1 hypothetical protein GNI_105680 [Gregarina niphandrodes]